MKKKTTQKEIKRLFKNVIRVGYCEVDALLKFEGVQWYNYGTNGWNCDITMIDLDTVIVSGYRPFGNIKPDYDVVRKYNDKAKEILKSNSNSEIAREKISKLVKKFVEEVA